jgi:hypothetical protein
MSGVATSLEVRSTTGQSATGGPRDAKAQASRQGEQLLVSSTCCLLRRGHAVVFSFFIFYFLVSSRRGCVYQISSCLKPALSV